MVGAEEVAGVVVLYARVPPDLKRDLAVAAAEDSVSQSALIEEYVRAGLRARARRVDRGRARGAA